ncbi:outer membrane beta-barrel family protein [Marinifilum fragile]|uniref:outer membrane beta-barrel family protein n=1 Tax=Marinifilum fragile TaxID=570161 RepID=UPI002AA9291D|nr:outer membrane beta-barrel family protein [Marinifilum fragile]
MRSSLLFLFFVCLFSVNMQAQDLSITGQVFDTKLNESLPFTQVAISNINSESGMSGTLTDDEGSFSLAVKQNSTYKIIIQYLGYETYEKLLNVTTESIDLGVIPLYPSAHNLQEVFVTAEKKSIGKENGNWVLYPDKLPEGGTNSAIELLSSIPSVSVDMEEAVSIRGRQASILIDGVKIDDQSELDQISPSSIAKIEVIQNPSAKYDADGSVINIQLKSPIQSRSSSKFRASVDHFGNHQENFSTNKKHNKWGGFFQVNSNINEFNTTINQLRENLLPGNSPYIRQARDEWQKTNSQQARTAINYRPSEKHLFKIDGLWQNNQVDPQINIFKELLNEEQVLTQYTEQEQAFEKDKFTQQYRAQYIGKWDKQTLKVSSSYRKQKQYEDRLMSSLNFDPEGKPINTLPAEKKDDINLSVQKVQSNLDYERELSDKLSFEGGIDWSMEKQTQNSIQEKYNHSEQDWIMVPSKTFNYQYENSSSALYGIIDFKTDNWFITAGSRLRYVDRSTNNARNEIGNQQHNSYLSLLPTFHAGRNWEHSDVSISYKKSHKLPRSGQLNSYKNDATPLNIYFGNPDLKPEKEHSVSLDYALHKEKFQVGIAIFHRFVENVIMQEYYTIGDTLFRSFDNLAKQFVTGNEYTFNYLPAKWCRLNGSGSIFHQKFSGKGISLQKKQLWSYSYKLTGQFKLPKSVSMHVNYTYNSKTLMPNGLKGELYNLDMAFSRDFFKKKLKVSLKGANLLDSKKQWNEAENIQFVSRSSRYMDTRRLIVGLVYKWQHSN